MLRAVLQELVLQPLVSDRGRVAGRRGYPDAGVIDEAAIRQQALEKLLTAEIARIACYEATERTMQALRIADATSASVLLKAECN